MTIFIPEYIIYGSNCPNLFFIDYSPVYFFILDAMFFDCDNYVVLYKTGAFSKTGYVKYPKGIHYNFYKNKGIEILRARMYEKFFFYKKFHVRRIIFQEMRYQKYVPFYNVEIIVKYFGDNFYSYLDFIKDKNYYTETSTGYNAILHPKKGRLALAKRHSVIITQVLREEIIKTIHYDAGDKLCLYTFGGNGKQYGVNLINFFFYSFYNKNGFEEIYMFQFFKFYDFSSMYRSLFPMFFEIYIYLDFILLIPIKCYLFYLFYHFIYDISFLLFFYNKFVIKIMLEIYYIIIGYYTSIIYGMSSIRMFKKTVLGKNYDLENLLKLKSLSLRNYCYKLFLNKGISKSEENGIRRMDDCVDYPFILIYMFKFHFQFFIFLERFIINLSYFFNKMFFFDLLKKYYLRNAISFFNFILTILFLFPIYMFFSFTYYIFYFTGFIKFFMKDTIYGYFNVNKFENIYEDLFRNLLLDKVLEEKYDYLIYGINMVKFEFFTGSYYKHDRERVHKKYMQIFSQPRGLRDAPIEDVIFEYGHERIKYGIGFGSKGFKGYKNYDFLNKIAGNYVKNKMAIYDHYYDDPFFFSACMEYLRLGFSLRNVGRMNLNFNLFLKRYLNIILNKLKSIFEGFGYYYFFIILFYPVSFLYSFLDFIQVIYMSFTFQTYQILIGKFYLHFIIVKNFLFSIGIVSKLVNIISYILNYLSIFIKKLRLYIETERKIRILSFEAGKFCLLFYFFFLRYKFVLKVFRIFFFRLGIFAFSIVILIFFVDNDVIGGGCYHIWGGPIMYIIDGQRIGCMFDPVYSNYFLFKNALFFNFLERARVEELTRYFFNGTIINMEGVYYIKAGYKIYIPKVHFLLAPFKDLIIFLGLDYKGGFFQIKLGFSMDYGFIRLNLMFAKLNFPTFYHVGKNFYDILLFSYIYFFIEGFLYYFSYRVVCFIDMNLNFFFFNEIILFIFNIFYNFGLMIYYYFIYFNIYYLKFYYDKFIKDFISDLVENVPPFFYLIYRYNIVRGHFTYDLVLLIQYYGFYFYHFLYYYSYEFLHNFYNYLIYILNFVYGGNGQYSTYNLIGYYDILNTNFTVPILVFFHKFFMYFLNSSNNLTYGQQEFPNINHGYQFPFVITKLQQYTGSTTLNRLFIETGVIKVNILENFFLYGGRYNSRFSSGLFLLSFVYVIIIMFVFIRLLVYASKSFRQMNVKTRLTQSGARLGYRMRPVESRHLYTDLEYDGVYSGDGIYEFPKYRKEFYPHDPITFVKKDKDINYFEGDFVVYRFLTKLFEYKGNQNNKYMGGKVLNNMDKYYNLRYKQVLDVVHTIFNNNIGGIIDQTKLFTDINFFFDTEYYQLELDKYGKTYHSHEDRYERFRDIVSYEDFLFKVVMPFLYMYCDDVKYVEYYMKNIGKMRTNLGKFETLLNDKEKYGLNFTEFFFTDKQFYEKFISEFQCQDADTIFGAFIEHRTQSYFNFKPGFRRSTFVLYRPNIYQDFYKGEDYFLKLTEGDAKYFNNLFNLSFYNTFEGPILMRTKIQLEQLQELFDAFDPFTMLEETEFLPSDTGIIRGDTETDYEIQQRVNHYGTTVLKKTNDDYHNELGLFTSKVMPLFSYLYGIYLPLILVGAQFSDTFNIHSNFLDFLPNLFSYFFSMFGYVDMEFSTGAINDPGFVVNPLMGVFISRDFGISTSLTYDGQGYQPGILFNIDVPLNYHSSLFIYSFSNVDFYPFENFFSKGEKSFYFYNVLPLPERLSDLPMYNNFLLEYPFGYDLFHLAREIKSERFYFMPLFNELFGSIVIYILGFLPRLLAVIPLFLIGFIFAFFIYVNLIRICDLSSFEMDELGYKMKEGRQKYGLFSKKQK